MAFYKYVRIVEEVRVPVTFCASQHPVQPKTKSVSRRTHTMFANYQTPIFILSIPLESHCQLFCFFSFSIVLALWSVCWGEIPESPVKNLRCRMRRRSGGLCVLMSVSSALPLATITNPQKCQSARKSLVCRLHQSMTKPRVFYICPLLSSNVWC